MLSRVANSLYWMSRNAERAENNARILDAQLLKQIEASSEEIEWERDWRLIFEICASTAEMENITDSSDGEDKFARFLALSRENPNSVLNCIGYVRENARTSRDHIPEDYWQAWNSSHLELKDTKLEGASVREMRAFLDKVRTTAVLSQGIVESAMTRDMAYQIIKIAKWLERAEKTARILNVVCERTRERQLAAGVDDYYYWRAALRMVNGYEAYLKDHPPRLDPRPVLEFLVSEDSFPRSIRYCMEHVRDAVSAIENGKIRHYSQNLFLALDRLLESLKSLNVQRMDSEEMMDFLNRFQNDCNEIGMIFSSTYYLSEPAFQKQSQGQPVYNSYRAQMPMKYKIEHTNIFDYDSIVDQSMNSIRLKPRTDECQRLLSYRADIEPATMTTEYTDIWGNSVETFYIAEHHQHLEVRTTSIVSVQRSPFVRRLDYSPEMNAIFYSQLFREHYFAYLSNTSYTYLTPEQIAEVDDEIGEMTNPVQYALDAMDFIHDRYEYNGQSTDVNTMAQESFGLRKGVCQDITHAMLGALRAKGIPARYVSGYLYVGENSALVGDAASHAWVEFMVPGIGWVGLDPTNSVEALENHIRVGVGRDYNDVSPVQGVYRGGNQRLDVKVSVSLLES
ncbi:alpha-E domain-containing protein [Indiicoccus explosivorum]|uniref:alpha-E domain-containing protein n=1 Tax=Indiicoccus explosivorum TaxID=1917864 RepID=UPI000B450442|nr:alpha-E domain-containing protein [Indiicoccus explosivorum]